MYELIPMEIAASGLNAQRIRAAVVASNLANAQSTRRPDGPGPYQRQMVVVRADRLPVFEDLLNDARDGQLDRASEPGRSRFLLEQHLRGVQVTSIQADASIRKEYNPNHPDADESGYVSYPDISVIQEMADMIFSSRNYEANLAVMKNTRDMLLQTLELLQG